MPIHLPKIKLFLLSPISLPFISCYYYLTISPLPMQTASFAKPFTISPRLRYQLNDHRQSIAVETEKNSNSMAAKWAQKTVVIPPQRRGCHLVTSKILKEIEQDLSGFKCGLAHLFLQHTSASLTINENYDSDVQDDTETFLNRIVPEGRSAPWKHTIEGPDDMPAHIKSSCLVVASRFQLLMVGSIWELGREYGCVSIGTMQLLEKWWLLLMGCRLRS